jgi:hypothetical protein
MKRHIMSTECIFVFCIIVGMNCIVSLSGFHWLTYLPVHSMDQILKCYLNLKALEVYSEHICMLWIYHTLQPA